MAPNSYWTPTSSARASPNFRPTRAPPRRKKRINARRDSSSGSPAATIGIGYKIACTNAIAQRFLSMPEPFYGRLLAASTFESPARLPAGDFFMRVIESEFAFQFARDLPPSARPLDREQIADALAGVLPGIEIVDSRFNSWTTVGAPSLIADNACHGAWVKGALVTDWRHLDLAAQAVELRVNGSVANAAPAAPCWGIR